MSYAILLFGVFILLAGAVILVKPSLIFDLFHSNLESFGLHALAVVVRLILGIALVTYAAESKYPVALQMLGWISITAAMIFLVIGRSRFKDLLTWALSVTEPVVRIAGIFAILFGGFLIYAVT